MRRLAIAGLMMLSSAVARGQTVETPVPFDSAQRILAVSPALAERLHLAPPTWGVIGLFREARLYSIAPGGGFVLVVQRPSGALERFLLTPTERDALGRAFDEATLISGRPTAELAADVVSEPAGNAFARRLTFLSAVAYGPLAASLTDDAAGAGALYLATTGVTFFASYGAAQTSEFTRAQSDLAGDFGLASGAAGWLLGYSATGRSERGVRAAALLSGLTGTIVGAGLGAHLSDAEAHAAIAGIETAAATTLTISRATGLDDRSTAAAVAILGGLGYPIGVRYPRWASYNVTAGDVEAISTTGLLGSLYAAATLGEDPGSRRIAVTLGAGYLAGQLFGDRLLARPFDLTQSQSNVLKVGGLAGGLVGLAIPVLSGSDRIEFIAGSSAIGATLGMTVVAGTFPRGAMARENRGGSGRGRGAGRFRFSVTPGGLAGVVSRRPGVHPLARLTF